MQIRPLRRPVWPSCRASWSWAFSQGEYAFDTDSARHFTDRERGAGATAAATNDMTLENLDSLFVAFFDSDVHTHRVTRFELGVIVSNMVLFNLSYTFHQGIISINPSLLFF